MDKLPVDLQYLDEDTKREPDGDIRLMLVETLMLLCNRKADRIFVRGKFLRNISLIRKIDQLS